MIIAFLSAWAGDNELLLLPFYMHNAYWCPREPHGVQKLLDHMYHLENNKDKGTPSFFFFFLDLAESLYGSKSL